MIGAIAIKCPNIVQKNHQQQHDGPPFLLLINVGNPTKRAIFLRGGLGLFGPQPTPFLLHPSPRSRVAGSRS